MANTSDLLTGASQLAALQAQRAGEGFSRDPADYRPLRIKLSGPEFNPDDPKYKPELEPDGAYLIGENIIEPKGVPVIVLGSLSGCRESDRLVENGRQTTRPYALWAKQPEVAYVKGKGGGKKTLRGGWIDCWHDELFLHTPQGLAVATLYDMHGIVAKLTQRATALGLDAMYDGKWLLTKRVPDGPYPHPEPHFELLGVAGEANGPTDRERAQAKKLSALIGQISYPNPGAPSKLVVNGEPMDELPPELNPPPITEGQGEGPDYGPGPDYDFDDSDLPSWMREGRPRK